MIIKSLENIDMQKFTACFNEAFSDYIIQFKATEAYLIERFKSAGVHYDLSFGAFNEDNKLVAFIMHGIDEIKGKKIAFNVGTGVVPEYRGKRLVGQLYEYAIPILKTHHVEQSMLEVIQTNEKALKAYSAVGFKINRELACFKGSIDINQLQIHDNLEITTTVPEDFSWEMVLDFWEYEPSWEQSTNAILRNPNGYKVYIITEGHTICGYAVLNPANGAILQFGVRKEKRGQGIGSTLFYRIGKEHAKTSILNIDKRDTETIRFLQKLGLAIFIEQYEMEKKL